MPLKTLFLNPPSFERIDGGASSRWPATRGSESYWYAIWVAYGMQVTRQCMSPDSEILLRDHDIRGGRGLFKAFVTAGQFGANELAKTSIDASINFFNAAEVASNRLPGSC
jgi:hypothetical protein